MLDHAARLIRALVPVFVAAALTALLWPASPMPPDDFDDLRDALERRARALWQGDGLRRPDGCVYTVDVGHLLMHAVGRGDRALYDRVRPVARGLVHDAADDPYTRGFVPWRSCTDTPPDASGTTEALRVARGLWQGGARFELPDDRALARLIVAGYGRHAATEYGVWMVRNYFNFQTRAFANDSYLVDYDPDLIAEMARETGDAALAELARRSTALVEAAVAPSGLIHTLVQPDVATIMPRAPVSIFSPNDVIQLNNACVVAETVVREAPAVGQRLLRFALARGDGLVRAYYGRTGEPVDATPADSTAWSCLVRLAARLDGAGHGVTGAVDALLPRAAWGWRWLALDETDRPYSTMEALLALDALAAGGFAWRKHR